MSSRVGIGMPCYNSGRYVGAAIESLLAQDFSDFDLFVSDNASTDGTWDIVEGYARRDRRVRAVRNETNLGAAANWNRVFEMSMAPYFKWASSNDCCAQSFLRHCVDVLDADAGTVLVCPRARMFEDDPSEGVDYPYGLDLTQTRERERFAGALGIRRNVTMNGMVRASALRRTALIQPYWGSDLVLIAALALQGRVRELPESLLFMRDTPEASTARMTPEAAREHHGPTMANRMTHQSLKRWWGYCMAVSNARLDLSERVALWQLLIKMARWSSRSVLAETLEAVRTARAGRQARTSAGPH